MDLNRSLLLIAGAVIVTGAMTARANATIRGCYTGECPIYMNAFCNHVHPDNCACTFFTRGPSDTCWCSAICYPGPD